MADPRRLAVRKAIANAIAGINGPTTYFNTVKATSIFRDVQVLPTLPASEFPAVVLGEMEPLKRDWSRGAGEGRGISSYFRDTVRLKIHCAVIGMGGGQGPKDDAAENMLADLEIALTPTDYTFGGLLTELRLDQPEAFFLATGLQNTDVLMFTQPVDFVYHRIFGVP